jgi:hypothetical protein
VIPRRNLVAAGVLLVAAVALTAAWHEYSLLLVFAVCAAAFGFVLWRDVRRGDHRND